MIYFTTFIFTLLLSHIASATPACGDVAYPEEPYDPTYSDAQTAQTIPVLVNNKFDNPNGDTSKVICSHLAPSYPLFNDIPNFPYIGGAWIIKRRGSQYCGCWKLTNMENHKTIYVTFIDGTITGIDLGIEISHAVYDALGRPPESEVGYEQVDNAYCKWK